MYVVEAADLHAVTSGNLLSKYADVITPASNSHTRTQELEHIEAWSKANIFTLNRTKSVEIIFTLKSVQWHHHYHYHYAIVHLKSLESPISC